MAKPARITLPILLLYICATVAFSQQNKKASSAIIKPTIPAHSKIYIARMTGGLEEFIATEIIKHKLPIELVDNQIRADYIIFGSSEKTGKQWYSSAMRGVINNKNEGSIQIFGVKDKVVVWSGRSGDRSLNRGMLGHGGKRKVAERIVEKMQRDLFHE